MGPGPVAKHSLQILNIILLSKGKVTHEIHVILKKTEPITTQTRVLEKHMLTLSTRRVPAIDIFEACICIQLGCTVLH